MHCFEHALMRDYLFALARELDSTFVRDDLLLDEVLEANDVHGMRDLLGLATDEITSAVHRLVGTLRIAA